MNAQQFRATLTALGLSTGDVGRLLQVNERTARRWREGVVPIPHAAALVLELMQRLPIARVYVQSREP